MIMDKPLRIIAKKQHNTLIRLFMIVNRIKIVSGHFQDRFNQVFSAFADLVHPGI